MNQMKKQIFFPAFLVAIFLWSGNIQAQVEDVANPLLKYVNRNNGLRFTAGGRLFTDVAYYHSEYTPMKSGAAITDARIRTSLKYKQFYFYADFDFSKGSFKQKNIFGQYNFKENYRGVQSVKAGYFCEPSTMAYNTSLYNYHFISRPAVVNALAPGRSLGITYKFFNQKVLADQGIFAENKYNDQISGFQGFSLSGRWLYKVINDDYMTLHVGLGLRYSRINTGRVVDDDAFKTEVTIESAMETYVDATTKFLNADVAWAKNILDLNPELLFKTDRLFVRGEYLYKRLYKDRPDFELFTNQLGGVWSWTTLDAWKAGNPIRSTKFDGGYVEAGYLIMGNRYTYNDEYGLLDGMNEKNSLEIVARYSIVNLNAALDTSGHLMDDRVGEAEGEIELVALSLGTIAHADELKLLLEANGTTLDHVSHESAHRANVGVGFAGFFNLLEVQSTVFFRDGHEGKNVHGDFTLRALNRDVVSGQRVADALNDLNRNLSNSTHFTLLG